MGRGFRFESVCFVLENEWQISSLEMRKFGSVTPKLLILIRAKVS